MTRDFQDTDNGRLFRLIANGELGRIEFPLGADNLVESVLRSVQNHYELALDRQPDFRSGDAASFEAAVIEPARLEMAARTDPGGALLWLKEKRPNGFGFVYVTPNDVEPAPPWEPPLTIA